MSAELNSLIASLRQFSHDRDWDQFHSPKNLACALSVEASEVLEHFQWLSDEQSRALPADKRAQVATELADVLLYLLQLADKLQVDLVGAAQHKLLANAVKYPVDKSRGNSRKYTEL